MMLCSSVNGLVVAFGEWTCSSLLVMDSQWPFPCGSACWLDLTEIPHFAATLFTVPLCKPCSYAVMTIRLVTIPLCYQNWLPVWPHPFALFILVEKFGRKKIKFPSNRIDCHKFTLGYQSFLKVFTNPNANPSPNSNPNINPNPNHYPNLNPNPTPNP